MNRILSISLSLFIFVIIFSPFIVNTALSQGTVKPDLEQNPTTYKPGVSNRAAPEVIRPDNPFTINSVSDLIDKLLDIIIKVGTVLALFFIIYAGFQFVTAGGSEDKINSAKNTFLWTIIGVAIVLGAKAISVLLQGTVTNVVGR